MSHFTEFVFQDYTYDSINGEAVFTYNFDGQLQFTERVIFQLPSVNSYDRDALDRALLLAFLIAGTSYYKCFPTTSYRFTRQKLSADQAEFLNTVYRDGMSQFIYENKLTLEDIVTFVADQDEPLRAVDDYSGVGTLVMQSGGKDSLLLATLLDKSKKIYTPWYVSSTSSYPDVLNQLTGASPRVVQRQIDRIGLRSASDMGALNGHVPVTYIIASYALVDAILHNENTVLMAIGNEGSESHAYVGQLSVNHQWSKTWQAEQRLQDYVHQYIATNIRIGSPLRQFSELKIAELFAKHAWAKYGHSFSSCNLANYKQGAINQQLTWDGDCSKCANSYLLFAPFVDAEDLRSLFGGEDLLKKPSLQEDFKGLLGIDGVMKPFECVGEIDELRIAYHMARKRHGAETYELPFDVPESSFDYMARTDAQRWATDLISSDI